MEDLQKLLAAQGFRLTAAKQAVFKALFKADRPLLVAEIQQRCTNIDRSSVYRVLTAFTELNIVTQVPQGWKTRYELAEPFKAHHHHLQCERCGELVALDTPQLEAVVHQLAKKHAYTLTSHHVELTGICAKCQ